MLAGTGDAAIFHGNRQAAGVRSAAAPPRIRRDPRSTRQHVPLVDRFTDEATAVPRRELSRLLDAGDLARQVDVPDGPSEPGRVVTASQVVQPGVIIHTRGELAEGRQVLGAQIIRAASPRKKKLRAPRFPSAYFRR